MKLLTLTRQDVLVQDTGQTWLAEPDAEGDVPARCGRCRRRPSLTASTSGRAPAASY
ncbi:MAG: hypothetical protein ABIR94_03875 [Rubrivivax sp.]